MTRPLEDVQDEILDRIHAGETVSGEAILKENPEHEEALTAFLEVIAVVEGTGDDLGPALAGLGEFRIIREIGRGGMGRVYEAEQTSLKRRVALKVLPPTLRLDARLVSRFHREAEAAGRLRHPGIVPVFSVGEAAGTPFFAMELVEGVSLKQVLEMRRAGEDAGLPTDPEGWRRWAVETVAKVADALAYAHGQGILHRDVKPGNILLDESGEPRLTDFGLAQDLRAPDLTQTGEVFGSPQYMSPEQAMRRDAPIDERTDVYSLAVTLYELLTLRLPYEGTSSPEVLSALLTGKVIPPRKVDASVPRALERVLLGALHKDPLHRYRGAAAFAHDLRATLEGAAPRHAPATPVVKHLRAPIAAAAILGLVVLAYALWSRSNEDAGGTSVVLVGDETGDSAKQVLSEMASLGPNVTREDYEVAIERLHALDTLGAREALREVYESYIQSHGRDDPRARAFLGYREFTHEVPEAFAYRRYPHLEVVEAAAEKRWFGPDEEDEYRRAEKAWAETERHLERYLATPRYRTTDRIRAQIAEDELLAKYRTTAWWADPHLICHLGTPSAGFIHHGAEVVERVAHVLEAVSGEYLKRYGKALGLKPLMDAFGGRPDLPLGVRGFEEGAPLVVLVFATRDAWLEYVQTLQAAPLPPTARAFFSPTTTYVYLCAESPDEVEVGMLAHAAIHQLQYWYRRQRNDWRAPAARQDWFEDGLAEYFAGVTEADDGTFAVDGLNEVRRQSMRSVRKALKERGREYPLIPVGELASFSSFTEAQQWIQGEYGLQAALGLMLFYEQAWALTYFLNHAGEGKYREGFTRYCDMALQATYGDGGRQGAFARAFGVSTEQDRAALEIAYREYVQDRLLE